MNNFFCFFVDFHSCIGLDKPIADLGTVRSLLEEVYVKAMPRKEWSVVRQAAGILKKVVNSLTINVADLLIRGKPVTIGFGQQEYLILNPLAPEVLSGVIFGQWSVLCLPHLKKRL